MFLSTALKIKLLLSVLLLFPTIAFPQINKSDPKIIIDEIILEGNKKTKENIVFRELLFQVGDTIVLSEFENKIARSRENLLNTSLFNFVNIEYQPDTESKIVSVKINMQERWYIWPYPVLEHADRNFSSFLKNQEWSRIDYGLYLLINNFRGRKEILKLKTIFGHNNELNIYYYNPFIDKNQKKGLGFDVRYIRNHEVPYRVLEDELDYLKLNNAYAQERLQISNFYTFRPKLYTHHLIDFRYTKVHINDSVLLLNGNYFFDQTRQIEFLSLGYVYNLDKRDSKIYPLKGSRFNFTIRKNGFGVLSKDGNLNLKVILDENISLSQKLFLTSSLLGQLNINSKNTFYFSKAIGYENYLRGMEYYVSNGNSFYITKVNLKYEIIPQVNFNMKFLPSDKFSKSFLALYANIFFDTGYVDSDYNFMNKTTNEFLYTGGIGIDIVTYYDKVLRIEYSLNKFGDNGIFFHLGAPLIEE